jgi:hypothetical protein
MKKLSVFFTFMALVSAESLQAQATGETAVATAQATKDNNWQNWAFAGSALFTAAGAILIVSMDNGHTASSTSH